MLLRVVAAERPAVVEGPLDDGLIVHSIGAARDVTGFLGAHGEEVAPFESAHRRLIQSARLRDAELRTMLAVGECLAIERTARDDGGVNASLAILAIANRQQHIAIGQIKALVAAGIRLDDRLALVIRLRHRDDFHAAPVLRRGRPNRVGHLLKGTVILRLRILRVRAKSEGLARRQQSARGLMPLRADVAHHGFDPLR